MAATISSWPGRNASKPKVLRRTSCAAARSVMVLLGGFVLYLFQIRRKRNRKRSHAGSFLAPIRLLMQGLRLTRTHPMLLAGNSADGLSTGRFVKLMGVLWLAGVAMRMTILAVPPVIPLIHDDLRMSETQVGLLIGLPLSMFALAAIPGSLLIARTGPRLAVAAGMVIAALAGAARGAAVDIATLYAAAIATGFGVAVMQPAMPTLVREWLPSRIALGTL